MNGLALLLACLGIFAVAAVGTRWVERHAARLGLVQAPNARSSHVKPTPTGGGLAICAAALLALVLLGIGGAQPAWPLLALTLVVGAIGLADDRHDLSPALRFPIQIAVFAVLVWWAWPLPTLPLPDLPIFDDFRIDGWLLAVGCLVVGLWWLNLFNFMDGIDGIAASQAMLIALGAILVWLSGTPDPAQALPFALLALVAAAAAGFLTRNWPPARIFMGDAGSNTLALLVFAAALWSVRNDAMGYFEWLSLPAVFVADATVTLVRRLLNGERPWRAHRRHAYQQLSRRWGHRPVTVLYAALTLVWALPWALLAHHVHPLPWPRLALTYLPLVLLSVWAGAGARSETRFASSV